MSIFEDKTYDDLDWMSKTIEPLVFKGNETLSKLPDRYELSVEQTLRLIQTSWSPEVHIKDVFHLMTTAHGYTVDENMKKILMSAYQIDCDELIDLDAENKTGPTVFIKKVKDTIPDKDILGHVIEIGVQILGWSSRIENKDNMARINEICDILDAGSEVKATRSVKKKVQVLRSRYLEIVQKDLWNVKDVDLLIKMAKWIKAYVCDENLAALANITKLKVMTHQNKPIYSMKETV